MKSALFYAITSESDFAKTFLSDLVTLLRAKPEQRNGCFNVLLPLMLTMTADQKRTIAEQVAREHGFGYVEAAAALQALQFLLRELTREEYPEVPTQDFADDLRETASKYDVPMSDLELNVFIETIDRLRGDVVPRYEEVKKEKATTTGILPSLLSFRTTVELRPVVANKFRIGMAADEYEPDIRGVVPVVSFVLEADSGVVDEFCVQMSPEELAALIEELRAAQVCLDRLQQFVHYEDVASHSGSRTQGPCGGT